jgi:hypothetical protein
MLRCHRLGIATLLFALVTNAAAAQSVTQASERDSLWNGTLIGAAAGVGSTAALDAVFCDNGFGGCDVPWAAYLTLGGLGAGAGAGIDLMIGRTSNERRTALRLLPLLGGRRTGVLGSLVLPQQGSLPALRTQAPEAPRRRDSVWDGVLIGAGIGAAGGAVWGVTTCGTTDDECFAIAGPAGIITGAGIGAAVGALADALHR